MSNRYRVHNIHTFALLRTAHRHNLPSGAPRINVNPQPALWENESSPVLLCVNVTVVHSEGGCPTLSFSIKNDSLRVCMCILCVQMLVCVALHACLRIQRVAVVMRGVVRGVAGTDVLSLKIFSSSDQSAWPHVSSGQLTGPSKTTF